MSGVLEELTEDQREIVGLVRRFVDEQVIPAASEHEHADTFPDEIVAGLRELGIFGFTIPEAYGGLGLDLTTYALAVCELSRGWMSVSGIINTHFIVADMLMRDGTDEQRERFLPRMATGELRCAFSMTEPECGSDVQAIRSRAVRDGDDYVVNGRKMWVTNGLRSGMVATLVKTDPEADPPQARNSAFIVETNNPGWQVVRDVETMSGGHNHCEIRLTDVRVPADSMLGERGGGHKLGQVRLGPARLAHCMRWIGQTEMALEMLVDRALNRYSHGSLLSDKQSIQWMMADSAMELYSSKLMVLHAAYKIENGLPFKQEVSFAKHHVAQSLWQTIDRAIQVHGALGYSTDTPLADMLKQARWARFADGADEIHQQTIARNVISAWQEHGSLQPALGDLTL